MEQVTKMEHIQIGRTSLTRTTFSKKFGQGRYAPNTLPGLMRAAADHIEEHGTRVMEVEASCSPDGIWTVSVLEVD